MNERIRKLAKKAGSTLNEGFDGKKDFVYGITMSPEELEKFAELIVRECLGCCEQVISDPVPESVDTWLNGGSQCIDEIKKHFGVER